MKKKPSLAVWILIGLFCGIIAGLCLTSVPHIANSYIKPFGTIFLNLIKFVVVPIVFFSIIAGVISLKDIKKVGSIGLKTIIFYFFTTAIAIILALIVANAFKGSFTMLETVDATYEATTSVSFIDTVVNIFPSNIIEPFSNAIMLQVIVGAILFGFGIIKAGEKGKSFANLVNSISDVCISVMDIILKLSPIGVFCLISPVIAEHGPSILGSLGMVLLCAYVGYFLHSIIVYSISVKALGNMSPIQFFKGLAPAMIFAFSSSSSMGTLPLNLECCEKMGAKREIASFVLPLGATINMDGTAIYQGVCVVFIAACFGIQLTIPQMITIILTATLASIGTAGVPGAGVVMLTMVLESVGLPVAGIALVIGVDRIFDMGRTVVNITGDAACTMVVTNLESKKEKKLISRQ